MRKVNPILHEKLETLINSMGYELVGAELLPVSGRQTLRIYIDSAKGVTLDDCSRVSHQVGAMLDVEEPLQGRYTLEVSSPGIDRPLFEIKHYQKFIGCRVKIRLYTAIDNRRQYKGTLLRVESDNIHVLVEESEKEVILPFAAIEKANLIGDVRI